MDFLDEGQTTQYSHELVLKVAIYIIKSSQIMEGEPKVFYNQFTCQTYLTFLPHLSQQDFTAPRINESRDREVQPL